MIDINLPAFQTYVEQFDNNMREDNINALISDLSNCKGSTIADLKSSLDAYSDLQKNINSLYSATSNYLHKALYNINLCEESNSVS